MDEQSKKKKAYRKRDIFIRFMVDEKECDMIYKRMEQTGIKNLRAYLMKQAIDGQVIHIELCSVKEMCRLLSNATNNNNQIARRANETGNIYAEDIADLQARHEEIWGQTKVILKKLAAMRFLYFNLNGGDLVATCWMKSLHVNKGKTIAQTFADRMDYAENHDKTNGGELVTGYACDPQVADEQFLLAKKEFEYLTRRNQGDKNVLAYHIRQAFKPGEVSPE